MKLVCRTLIITFFPVLVLAAINPDKLYTDTYDGVVSNIGEWSVSFFRKGTDILSLDWDTKRVQLHQCNVPTADFYAYQLSQRDSIYLIKRAGSSISDGWVLGLSGTCLKVSDLVTDFPSQTVSQKVYYSEKLKQLVIAGTDYRIAPADGYINVFIDLKKNEIVNKAPGKFLAGVGAVQHQDLAVSIGGKGHLLNFYNTELFTLEKSVDFGELYISAFYLKESIELGLNHQYLISAADRGRTFLGYYDKTTDQITKRFEIGCYNLKFSLENNLSLCFDTPPGGPWSYYIQDLTTGKKSAIWDDLWKEPKLSSKNSLIIANKQNGQFSFYNILTKQKTDFDTDANAGNFFFFDKDEKYLISVSNNWSGEVEVEKFPIADPTKTTLLYKLNIPDGDDYGSVIFNDDKNKLFIQLNKGGAYYLDIK